MLQRDRFFGRTEIKPSDGKVLAPPQPAGAPAPLQKQRAPEPSAPPENPRPATAAPAPVASAAAPEGAEGSKLIVGPNIKLKGVEITDCDTLIVEGHVEATMDSRCIRIAPDGSFTGTAGIDVAEIRGRFSGDLTVRKCLTIHATGKVTGKVRYARLVVEEGGELSGEIAALGTEERSARGITAPAVPRPLQAAPAG